MGLQSTELFQNLLHPKPERDRELSYATCAGKKNKKRSFFSRLPQMMKKDDAYEAWYDPQVFSPPPR